MSLFDWITIGVAGGFVLGFFFAVVVLRDWLRRNLTIINPRDLPQGWHSNAATPEGWKVWSN